MKQNNNQLNKQEAATIHLIAYCECGERLDNFAINYIRTKTPNGLLEYALPVFTPLCCPKCGKYFDRVQYKL